MAFLVINCLKYLNIWPILCVPNPKLMSVLLSPFTLPHFIHFFKKPYLSKINSDLHEIFRKRTCWGYFMMIQCTKDDLIIQTISQEPLQSSRDDLKCS